VRRRQIPAGLSALILIAAIVAFVTGCGGGSKTASKAATQATQTTPSKTATQGSQTTPNKTASVTKHTIPAGAVAVVAGRPIALSTLNHWMFIAAKTSSAQTPGQPVIVPTHPPAFATCIAQLRKQVSQLASSSVAQLRAECGQLFTSLEGQAMDFLIKSHWYEAEAERLRITPTAAQVSQAYDAARRQQFPTGPDSSVSSPRPDRLCRMCGSAFGLTRCTTSSRRGKPGVRPSGGRPSTGR
jgi:hypothetical protein